MSLLQSTMSLLEPLLANSGFAYGKGALKVLALLLLLLNFNNFPPFWHIRTFWRIYAFRRRQYPYKSLILPIKDKKASLTIPGVEPRLKLDAIPVGKNIFEEISKSTFTAWAGDCDWNMHLSNSSYGKVWDWGRIGCFMNTFARVGSDGGLFALGATTYTFHREIPIFSTYEVHTSIYTWDEKWFYMIGRFVSTKKDKRTSTATTNGFKPNANLTADGRTIYCTGIARYCFKHKRRTIPPWLIVATGGFGTSARRRADWDKAESLRRDLLEEARRKNKGKPLRRDPFLLGAGESKYGLFSRFHEAAAQGAEWTKPSYWALEEFEETRAANLAKVAINFS